MKEVQICKLGGKYSTVRDYLYIIENGDVVSYYKGQKGRTLKNRYATKGYRQISLHNGPKSAKVHRLVALAFIPNTESKPQINHLDGDKTNNSVNNLEWCTQSENILHSYATGLNSNIGVNNNRTHLTEAQVIKIYRLAHTGNLTQKKIGELFGICGMAVSKIKIGVRWSHLTKNIVLQTENQEQTSIVASE